VLSDDRRRLSEVRLRMYTQLVTRSRQKSATENDIYCESFRYYKSARRRRPGPDATPSAVRTGAVAMHAVVRSSVATEREILLTDLVMAETVYVLESFDQAPRDQVA
jgi:hypothetical protein